jgi:hypothetical protein
MREISPAVDLSAENFLKLLPPSHQDIVTRIRDQKKSGTRNWPSATTLDRSALLSETARMAVVDAVARLVDENLSGRSDMCMQFADLLHRALRHLHLPARAVLGKCIYYLDNREIFRWDHAWVRVGHEVIDGNVDILSENPLVPSTVIVRPYWGPITEVPGDRKLRENHGAQLSPDTDVEKIWWPELEAWLDANAPRGTRY